MQKKNRIRKPAAILCSIALALFLLSASLACTILIREFYYIQIRTLKLPEKTGYSEAVIREAYDEMMDYLAGGGEAAGRTFRTGELAWSDSGKAHFDDVERLFRLDFWMLGLTGTFLCLYLAVHLIRRMRGHRTPVFFFPGRFLGRSPLFWAPAGLMAVFALVGVLAASDFDRFFVFFHHLFFPGKENWIFNYKTDAVINILPQAVFRNFGLIVLAILVFLSLVCIGADFWSAHRTKAGKDAKCPDPDKLF